MPQISIESLDDPRVAPYADLGIKSHRCREGKFIGEGRWIVRRMLASDYQVESVLVARGHEHWMEVPATVPLYVASAALIETLAGFRFHRGILACGQRRPTPPLAAKVADVARAAMIVICSGVRDPANLGGILRNCAAFGVDLVVLGNHCADPWSRRVLRVSMASVLKLDICQSENLRSDLLELRDRHAVHLVATVLDRTADHLVAAPRPRRLGLVLGHEGHGLDARLVEICDERVTIPMRFQTDSLNVAVASGIFLYHFNNVVGHDA